MKIMNVTPSIANLIERVESGECSNSLDVLIECALFEPDEGAVSIRPNSAGTKVIYTSDIGTESTHWAREWVDTPESTIAALKARLSSPTIRGEL